MSRSPHVATGGSASPSDDLREVAVDWISRRDAGLSPAEEAAFQAWLAADSRHAAAIEALQPAWSMINRPRYLGRGDDLRRRVAAQVARKRRRRYTLAISSLAAAAVIAFAFFSLSAVPGELAPTVVLRPDQLLLPDGSTVELNFGAEIATDFTAEKRGVRLVRGEALFHVAKDASRPFVVAAGRVAVRAVGTAFTVRFDPEQVDILVTEGRVAVEPQPVPVAMEPAAMSSSLAPPPEPAPLAAPVFLSAGRRIVFSADATLPPPAPQPVSSAEVASALAWRNRRVEFNGTALREAVPIFNRDNALQLSIADATTGELRISGVYWTNDPEAFSRVVEMSLGIRAVREASGGIVFQR